MFYDKKKPLKPQLDVVKGDILKMKPFLDDYIMETLSRRTNRDLVTLSKIKDRTDEKFRIHLREMAEQRTTDIYKRIIEGRK